jgi:hypothetical protein
MLERRQVPHNQQTTRQTLLAALWNCDFMQQKADSQSPEFVDVPLAPCSSTDTFSSLSVRPVSPPNLPPELVVHALITQDRSMVEIKQDSPAHITQEGHVDPRDLYEDSKHRLLYSRSKVYVHPTGLRAMCLMPATLCLRILSSLQTG